jgi:hypothetical protein
MAPLDRVALRCVIPTHDVELVFGSFRSVCGTAVGKYRQHQPVVDSVACLWSMGREAIKHAV